MVGESGQTLTLNARVDPLTHIILGQHHPAEIKPAILTVEPCHRIISQSESALLRERILLDVLGAKALPITVRGFSASGFAAGPRGAQHQR
jgi:hypothetical protein